MQLFPKDGSFRFSVEAYHNAVEASLKVWLADCEAAFQGQPGPRQQMLLLAAEGNPVRERFRLWIGVGDQVLSLGSPARGSAGKL